MDHPFERILLATEHTEFDGGAERVAIELARSCALPLMAVVPLPSNPEYEAVAPELAARADALAAEHLAALRAAAVSAGVALDPHVRHGEECWREIVAEATQRDADLLVTRRRGRRSFLAKLLVGDMVGKVAAHAPCSVLMVPRGGGMWQRRVLAAVDGSQATAQVASVAAAIARRCALPLRLVSVIEEDTAAARKRAEIALVAAGAAAEGMGQAAVLVGKPVERIVGDAAASGADLIVIGATGTASTDDARLGATAHKVIGLAEGPVLVVR